MLLSKSAQNCLFLAKPELEALYTYVVLLREIIAMAYLITILVFGLDSSFQSYEKQIFTTLSIENNTKVPSNDAIFISWRHFG